jgi:hypothetical protein
MREWWDDPKNRARLHNEAFSFAGAFAAAFIAKGIWHGAPFWWLVLVAACGGSFTYRVSRRWHKQPDSDNDAQRPA